MPTFNKSVVLDQSSDNFRLRIAVPNDKRLRKQPIVRDRIHKFYFHAGFIGKLHEWRSWTALLHFFRRPFFVSEFYNNIFYLSPKNKPETVSKLAPE